MRSSQYNLKYWLNKKNQQRFFSYWNETIEQPNQEKKIITKKPLIENRTIKSNVLLFAHRSFHLFVSLPISSLLTSIPVTFLVVRCFVQPFIKNIVNDATIKFIISISFNQPLQTEMWIHDLIFVVAVLMALKFVFDLNLFELVRWLQLIVIVRCNWTKCANLIFFSAPVCNFFCTMRLIDIKIRWLSMVLAH